VLTPSERAAQNGNGRVGGGSTAVGDVGAPVQR
jgi:cell division protease FtsH